MRPDEFPMRPEEPRFQITWRRDEDISPILRRGVMINVWNQRDLTTNSTSYITFTYRAYPSILKNRI